MTSSGKDWCGPVHPITNLTTHTNMLFLFVFFPFPFILNMHTWTCGHTLSHTYVLFSFILQCNNRSQIQKSAGFYRKQSVCTKQKRKDIEGCDELTYSVRGKIKAVEKCIGNWGQFSGPLCHVQHTVTSSRWVFENKANGIPASLLFFSPLEKSGHGEKQGEGMWILFGWETKRQTKGRWGWQPLEETIIL